MTKDEALKLALEALEQIDEAMPFPVAKLAQKAIREALAQPEGCQCPACKITPHASDCAVHNEPAYPKGACNCGAQPEQEPYQTQLERFAALVAAAEREACAKVCYEVFDKTGLLAALQLSDKIRARGSA